MLPSNHASRCVSSIPIRTYFTGEDEIEKAKEELSDTKEKLRRAGEKKEEREELKAKLKRAKETNKFQKTQIEDIQNDFKEQLHTAIMTQWVAWRTIFSNNG